MATLQAADGQTIPPITEEDRRRLRIFRDLTIISLQLTKKAKIFE